MDILFSFSGARTPSICGGFRNVIGSIGAKYIVLPYDHDTRKYQTQELVPTKTTRTAACAATAARSVSAFAVENVAIAKANRNTAKEVVRRDVKMCLYNTMRSIGATTANLPNIAMYSRFQKAPSLVSLI
jgi:hypothetical protein